MKRKWLMVPLATGILAAGLTGAMVLAHNEDGAQESPKDKVVSKVAAILGLDTQVVQDALTQATQEMRSERQQQWLDDMVSAGRLTQDQADAYAEWYAARPEGLDLGGRGHGRLGFGGGRHRFGGHGFHGQEQLPPLSGGEVPEGSGTSF